MKNLSSLNFRSLLVIVFTLINVSNLKAEQESSLTLRIDTVCVVNNTLFIDVEIFNGGNTILLHKPPIGANCYGVLFFEIFDKMGNSYYYDNCSSIIDAESLDLDSSNSIVLHTNEAVIIQYKIRKKEISPRIKVREFDLSVVFDYRDITLINSLESYDGNIFVGHLKSVPYHIKF